MSIGSGVAIAGIWIGVGLCGLSMGVPVIGVAVFAALATFIIVLVQTGAGP